MTTQQNCPKCGASFLNGTPYWLHNSKEANPLDLAGLVCNPHGDSTCINPMKGQEGGDTWAIRMAGEPNPTAVQVS